MSSKDRGFKFQLTLSRKLVLAIFLPTLAALFAFGAFCWHETTSAVEVELGRRLVTAAQLLSRQLTEDSVALLQPGDEQSRTHRNLRKRLLETRDALSLARIYIFAPDHTLRIDTDDARIGDRNYRLDSDRVELARLFSAGTKNRTATSKLFRGKDGAFYKSGFAALESSQPQFAVGVEGNAPFYAELRKLRDKMMMVGGGTAAALLLLALLIGYSMRWPLMQLAKAARSFGHGVFRRPLCEELMRGSDEVATLAQTVETMRQGLLARDQRMQMMLAGIAHEVRNPLGGMELFAGLAREELAGQACVPSNVAQVQRYLERISIELEHLQKVVEDFLTYARRPRPQIENVPLDRLLRDVRDSIQAKAGTVTVEISECPTDVCLAVDPQQTRRALENLTLNAVQACADQKEQLVTLAARVCSEQVVVVSIKDTGPGIPDDVLRDMWTPFFTTRADGTGLGLAFVREIIGDHLGTIQVDTSKSGTTFSIALPVSVSPRFPEVSMRTKHFLDGN